jgi:hypothetical protein
MSTQPERVRAYLELPSEQLNASTPGEFSHLLGRIMTAKGLTASQVSIKAEIPRSQTYNMVSASRGKLPSRPEQVRAFVEACNLAPFQVALVMDLWGKLEKQAREQSAKAPRPADSADPGAGTWSARGDDDAVHASNTRRFFRDRSTRPEPAAYRPKMFVDLMFLVIEDDARTRRALMLLVPIMLAFIAVFAILVVWAVLQPERTNMIVGILGATIAIPAVALRGVTRVRG